MSGEDQPTVMVNNNYKSAIRAARSGSVTAASELEKALAKARQAMDEGAWEGPKGTDFSGELDGHRSSLNAAGPAALKEFDDAIAGQPDKVEQGAWQVHWQRMGPR